MKRHDEESVTAETKLPYHKPVVRRYGGPGGVNSQTRGTIAYSLVEGVYQQPEQMSV